MRLVPLLLWCIASVVFAAPVTNKPYNADNVQLVKYENKIFENVKYKYGFELSDGTKQHQRGGLQNLGNKVIYRVSGTFSWVAPDGVEYEVAYYADDTGYHIISPNVGLDRAIGAPYDIVASSLG
ncbi:hypothetical protein O3G_MSEX013038 [Manduca sexta]|uniref:Cuticle protein n=1 Tax=Manduca sexta TaxID=7130 RepID=A0A922CWG0_MANSE|nr:hypothetical protein O3G_MSEX013036 [Manduca sexta]KAG6462066.1 hypothetical protein O3G_MSEX013038 [Manduca sexta]KAG6462067.1 hypothetical protein O3G_MSEX013038 [Manduca sexta]